MIEVNKELEVSNTATRSFSLTLDARDSTDSHPLVAKYLEAWRGGAQADARQVLQEYPELASSKSAVMDLVYGEYCFRLNRGEAIQPKSFSSRFPRYRSSIYKMLAVEQYASQNPQTFGLSQSIPWPEVGGQFLQYSLLAELGRGAIGRVYLAMDPDLGDRLLVIKVSHQRTTQEARTLGKLNHRNVVEVLLHEEDLEQDLAGVCMPYLARTTLQDLLDAAYAEPHPASPPQRFAEPLRQIAAQHDLQDLERIRAEPDRFLERASYVDGVLHLGQQLASALAHTHERGICHLDLKPSNVLLTPTGVPILLDFNLSGNLRGDSSMAGGTLPYMSPEQIEEMVLQRPSPDGRPLDPRSDLFSLGVLLYELLTGSHPFGPRDWRRERAAVGGEVLASQKAGPPPIHELNPQVDRRSSQLIQSCLAFDRDQRPASAAALHDRLKQRLSPLARTRRYWMARPFLNAATFVCAMFLAALMLWLTAIRPPRHQREWLQAVEAYQRQDYDGADHLFTNSIDHFEPNFEAHFGRAQTRLKLRNYAGAADDFRVCYNISGEKKFIVAVAYTHDLLGQHERATTTYHTAMKAGCDSVAYLNNAGYCCFERGLIEPASKYIERALVKDPNCPTARYNRARLSLRVSTRDQKPCQLSALEDIEFAISAGLKTNRSFFVAASLYRQSNLPLEERTEKAIQHLTSAVRLGLKIGSFPSFEKDPATAKHPKFAELSAIQKESNEKTSEPLICLIHPFGESAVYSDLITLVGKLRFRLEVISQQAPQ